MKPALERAEALRAQGRLADAERLYRTLLIDDPAQWPALVGIGICARLRRDLVASAEHLAAALALAPGERSARLEYATTLREHGRIDQAEPLYRGLLADEPGWWPALAGLGLCARVCGDLETAASHLATAAAQAGDFALWVEWFEAERARGDAAGIATCLAAARPGTDDDRARLWEARAMAAVQGWRLDEAARALDAALALAPARGDLHEAGARLGLLRLDIAAARTHLRNLRRCAAADSFRGAHAHLGNMLDDYVIDTAALAALQQAQALAPGARFDRLRALVRDNPDHTATAIALLLSLREAAPAPAGPRRRERRTIPSIIACYADTAAAMPDWAACNPQARLRSFDHDAAYAFLRARAAPETLLAFRRAREAAVREDVFRLAFLFIEGGCFAGTATRCLRPLDPFLPAGVGFVAAREPHGALGTEFVAAAPGHPLLAHALRQATLAVNRGDGDMRWLSTGPGLLARSLAYLWATTDAWPGDVRILEPHALARIVAL